jgi:hypothetical protein
MDFPGFIGGAYQSQAVTFDAQRCVNLYPEIDESHQGKGQKIGFLAGTPGLTPVGPIGVGVGRAGGIYIASNNSIFILTGDTLRMNLQNSATIGTIYTTTGPVCMTDNGVQLVLVDGQDGWIYTFATGVFSKITSPNMPVATKCIYMDGYILFNEVNSQRYYFSNLLDASTIDALDFQSAIGSPDNITSMEVIHRQIWITGLKSIEVHTDTGDANTPFQRLDGVFIEHGCESPDTLAKINNTLFWLGAGDTGHAIVWMAEGFSPRRISTHAVEYALSQYADLSGASAWVYCDSGHQFYMLQIPGASTTWCYDVATSLWHERASLQDGQFTQYWPNAHGYYNGSHIVNDSRNNCIYSLDPLAYDDNGTPKKWLRAAPYLAEPGLNRMFHHRLQIDMQTGVGDAQGQGLDPKIMMRYTNDGQTWSKERLGSIGKMGQYLWRVIWTKLGSSRTRAYEISGTDPVKIILLAAEVDVEQGAH